MNKIAVILLTYWKEREKNIPLILDTLKNQKDYVGEIFIFNNNPEIKLVADGFTLINSSRNLAFLPRHAIALLTESRYCLFVDDDLLIGKETIPNFLKWSQEYPEAILGYWGRKVKRDSEKPYMDGEGFIAERISKPISVDTITGRLHFCKSTKAIQSFKVLELLPDPRIRREDDILISLANRFFGFDNYVIPARGEELCQELSEEGVGDWRQRDYWNIRDRAVSQILNLKNE